MCVSLWHSNKGQRGRSIIPCDIQKPNLYQLFLKVILPQLGVSCARPQALAHWMRMQQHQGLRLPFGMFTVVSSFRSFVPLLSIYPVVCIMPGHSRAMFPDLSEDKISLGNFFGGTVDSQEDSTSCGATKPTCHDYWVRVLRLLKPVYLESVLHKKRSDCSGEPVHLSEGGARAHCN